MTKIATTIGIQAGTLIAAVAFVFATAEAVNYLTRGPRHG